MSDAVIHGNTVYCAGQVAGAAKGGSVTEQTADVLAQIDALLAKCGTSKANILSATIILSNISTFAEMNAVWDAWVDRANPPARATIEARLAELLCAARDAYNSELAMITCSAVTRQMIRRLADATDLPILLVRVVEEDDLPLVRQVLQAQEYWRLKGLRADVVILNEHPVSYLDEMHVQLTELLDTGPWVALHCRDERHHLGRAGSSPCSPSRFSAAKRSSPKPVSCWRAAARPSQGAGAGFPRGGSHRDEPGR
ncbi:MAG: hypothetical protein HC779_04070 [Phyllobacteriaceae bacterium]|nr:hypothetical protein [Phyllobacteriaceae bacterium]